MYSEILHHIERLQVELASVNSQGGVVTVTNAVARIAARLREEPGYSLDDMGAAPVDTPVFMQ